MQPGHLLRIAAALVPAVCAACNAPRYLTLEERGRLARQAELTLTRGLSDPQHAVRIRAIEAMQDVAPQLARVYVVEALADEYAGVRFAALMAIGTLRQRESLQRIRRFESDPDPNVRIAWIYAMHRLGDTRHTTELSGLLLSHRQPGVRANAAVAIGKLGERGAVTLLATATRDRDESVRLQALEAMLALGNRKALRELCALGISGMGAKGLFALLALQRTGLPEVKDLYESQFAESNYDEVKLAAAGGLGRLGDPAGLKFATDRLTNFRPSRQPDADPPEQQAQRVKTLAALALELICSPEALAALEQSLRDERDAQVRIAVARAAVAIIHRDETMAARRTVVLEPLERPPPRPR